MIPEKPSAGASGRFWRGLALPLARGLGGLKRSLELLASRRGHVGREELFEEELDSFITEGRAEGVMDQGEEDLLRSVIEFGDTLVREVMVPRVDVAALEISTPLPEVVAAIVRRRHSRWPVYRETIDQVVGILHARTCSSSGCPGATGRLRSCPSCGR